MTTMSGQLTIRVIMLLFTAALLFSCGSDQSSVQENRVTGIAYRLKWPVGKSVASVPAGVATVRMSVSGPGMNTLSKDFPASANTGTIDNVPVGTGRTITFQGLDSSRILKYEKVVPNVTLVPGLTYNCGAVSMDVVGTAVPTSPGNLAAIAVSSTLINLVWSDSNDETGYRIERKSGVGGTYEYHDTASANTVNYSDSRVSANTTYYYRVRASNGVGDSAYSNEVAATTPVASYSISGTITTSGGGALAGVTVALTGSGSTVATTDSSGNYSFAGALDGSYTLTPGMAGYSFSPSSLPVTVNGASQSGKSFLATVTAPPASPSGLTATTLSSSSINIAWADNAINETGYKIERRTGGGGVYIQVGVAAANATYYDDLSLSPATDYYYRVRATNSIGDSVYSNEASAATSAVAAAITPELVSVPGGSFTMGSGTAVSVGSFYIGKYEVKRSEWRTVMEGDPSYTFADCVSDSCPVQQVSWNDIQTFLSKLNALSGKSYRLPTDAEWEYAARYGAMDMKYSGSSSADAVAWYGVSSGSSHMAGTKDPNILKIYDMSGNVWEWVNSRDTVSPSNYVVRGGACNSPLSDIEVTFHRSALPDNKSQYIGFRLAITTP